MKTNPVLEAIFTRCSVRSYTGQGISPEDVTLLLQAGMAAPSGRDLRPWEFVAVLDRPVLDELAAGLASAKFLGTAGAAIVVCASMEKNAIAGTDYWVADCALAAQNILLAAHSLGFGAIYAAAWPYADRSQHVRETLHLPPHVVPLCILAIGHANGNECPKNKWNPQAVHWNGW